MKKNHKTNRPVLAGLLFFLFMMSISPVTAYASEATDGMQNTRQAAPPIIDDEVIDPVKSTAKSTDQEQDTQKPPVVQEDGQNTDRPPIEIFLLIIFVLGTISGYSIRGAVEKRKNRDSDMLSEADIDQAYKEVDEEYYNKDPEPKRSKAILSVTQPRKKREFVLTEDDLAVDDETYVLPQGKARRLSEDLEPVDVDFYNRPYYYDEDGMPYYHDPNTGEPVYYHEIEQEELI